MLSFSYLSSTIDWCESNFKLSTYICEYFNSFSSLSFCFIAYYHIKKYNCLVKSNRLLWNLLFINNFLLGLSSFLFHATLSEFGQCLDELFILTFIYILSYIISSNKKMNYILFLLPIVVFILFPNKVRFALIIIGIIMFIKNRDKFDNSKLKKGLCFFIILFYNGFIFLDNRSIFMFTSNHIYTLVMAFINFNCST